MTSDAPDIHTLSGAYALGALDADEAGAFEGHLESCAACREEQLPDPQSATEPGPLPLFPF